MEVSYSFDSYFNDESDTETINFVAPNEFLDNSASMRIFMLTLMLEMNQLVNLCRKKQSKTVTLHKAYTPPVRSTLKEGETI